MATQEIKDFESERGSYVLTTDGSGTGDILNPGDGAIGGLLRAPNGNPVAEISKRIGPATNTVAEYQALIEGLELALSQNIERIRVFVDSELLVDQLDGHAQVRQDHLVPLHERVAALVSQIPNIRVSWIPRKWNSEADALATKALHEGS